MRAVEGVFSGGLEAWVLGYLLNSLWQIPLVFVAAMAAARLARGAGPQMEHRVWVGALGLEVVLPFCHLHVGELLRQTWGLALSVLYGSGSEGQVRVALAGGTASRVALPWLAVDALAVLMGAYLCGLVYFSGRLGWGVWVTEALRRSAVPVAAGEETGGRIARFKRLLGVGGDGVEVVSAPGISGPATVGFWRHTLILPPGFLDGLSEGDLDALLAHEFAHMRRLDFAKNLVYGLASLPAAYHPALWMTQRRLSETRELVCDGMAAQAVGGRESYARSLLRLARMLTDRERPRILHAIGILDANIFERRVMHLTGKRVEISSARRLGIATACVVVGLTTCTAAMALRTDVSQTSAKSTAPAKIHVKPDALTLVKKSVPVYPVDAKKAKIQGKVALDAIIGKDGTIQHLSVISGPTELQQSAMDAVRQWEYQPFLLNGNPVEVETTINVIYTLAK
jgi:TonB family protein